MKSKVSRKSIVIPQANNQILGDLNTSNRKPSRQQNKSDFSQIEQESGDQKPLHFHIKNWVLAHT